MSDLTATNCGCNNDCGCNNNRSGLFGGDNSCIWIIILLLFFCNGSNGCGSTFSMSGSGCGCDNNGCSCIWIIILLLFFCNGNGCGC